MFSLKNKRKELGLNKSGGFTIVELLIVIVVIGILATLVIVTFTGIQKKARDSQRQTDVQSMQSQLEAYYTNTGTYPALSMMNDGAWRSANMKGLDPDSLKDPKATTGNMAVATSATVYGYTPLLGTAACTVTGTGAAATADCDAYTLTATLEGGGTFSKASN